MSLNVLDAGASPSVTVDEEKALVSKVAWRLMPLIMVCYLFAFFDRINISFAKFQLQTDLSLSDTAYGLGAGLFVVGYVIFEVPSNMMLYKVGAEAVRGVAQAQVSLQLKLGEADVDTVEKGAVSYTHLTLPTTPYV